MIHHNTRRGRAGSCLALHASVRHGGAGNGWEMRCPARQSKAVLMRHESIETTMRFYVGQNANAVARQCWEAVNA